MRRRRIIDWLRRRRKAPSLWRGIRDLTLASPTVYVVSFPKCGRTWLRLMLGHYLAHHFRLDTRQYLDVGDFHRMDLRIPAIEFYHDDKPYKKAPSELSISKHTYRKHKVICLVRDPRDVVVSRFFSRKYREKNYQGNIHDFLREEKDSLSTIVAYYNIWMLQCDTPRDFALIRYEEMHDSPVVQLRRLLNFMDIQDHDIDLLAKSVDYARFKNMRQLEQGNLLRNSALQPVDPADTRTYKTRRGIVGDHRNLFDHDDLAYADQYIKEHLHPAFGYAEPSTIRRTLRERRGATDLIPRYL